MGSLIIPVQASFNFVSKFKAYSEIVLIRHTSYNIK